MYERFIKANAISNNPAPDTWKNSRPRRSILDSRFAECGGISINNGLYRVHLIYFRKNDDSLRLYLSSNGSIPAKFSGKINVTYFDNDTYKQLEALHAKGQLEKVNFDGPTVEPACDLIYDSASKAIRKR
jgi:hypothetical protein